MRSETEIKWIAIIYKHFFGKLINTKIPLKKLEYEKLCKAPERNKLFSEWFDFLVEDGTLIHSEYIYRNRVYMGYLPNHDRLIALAQLNENYKIFYVLCNHDTIAKV